MNYDDYVSINKKTYDDVSLELKERHKRMGINEPTVEQYYQKIIKYLKHKDNLKYLELGPGDGKVLSYFSKNILDTTAIEISEKMAQLCLETSPTTKIIQDDIKNVTLNNESFDIIFAGSFVHLFPEKDLTIVMKKAHDWLKKDGVFFIYTTVHDKDEEGYFAKEKSNYSKQNVRFRHHFTNASLEKLLINHNFKILEHYEIPEPENNRLWQFLIATK